MPIQLIATTPIVATNIDDTLIGEFYNDLRMHAPFFKDWKSEYDPNIPRSRGVLRSGKSYWTPEENQEVLEALKAIGWTKVSKMEHYTNYTLVTREDSSWPIFLDRMDGVISIRQDTTLPFIPGLGQIEEALKKSGWKYKYEGSSENPIGQGNYQTFKISPDDNPSVAFKDILNLVRTALDTHGTVNRPSFVSNPWTKSGRTKVHPGQRNTYEFRTGKYCNWRVSKPDNLFKEYMIHTTGDHGIEYRKTKASSMKTQLIATKSIKKIDSRTELRPEKLEPKFKPSDKLKKLTRTHSVYVVFPEDGGSELDYAFDRQAAEKLIVKYPGKKPVVVKLPSYSHREVKAASVKAKTTKVKAYADYVRAAAFKIFGKGVGIDPSNGTKDVAGENVVHITPAAGVDLKKHKEFAEMLKGINSVEYSAPDTDFKPGSIKVVFKKNVKSAVVKAAPFNFPDPVKPNSTEQGWTEQQKKYEIAKARKRGEEDCKRGIQYEECPYSNFPVKEQAWKAGWNYISRQISGAVKAVVMPIQLIATQPIRAGHWVLKNLDGEEERFKDRYSPAALAWQKSHSKPKKAPKGTQAYWDQQPFGTLTPATVITDDDQALYKQMLTFLGKKSKNVTDYTVYRRPPETKEGIRVATAEVRAVLYYSKQEMMDLGGDDDTSDGVWLDVHRDPKDPKKFVFKFKG